MKVVEVRVWALPFWPRLWSHELGWHVWVWPVHVAEVHTTSQACILDSVGWTPALLSDSHGYCRCGISYLSHHAQQGGQRLNNSGAESCLFFPPLFGGGTSLGAGIAQWLQCRTLDWKVTGSNPCWSGGRIFFSRVNFLCWLLFRYPFHPRVTTVARKRSWSFCQKCRWQVTAKHAYTLSMWLCMKWHGAWLYGVHRICARTAAVSCGTSHASTVSTPLRWILKIKKTRYKASQSLMQNHMRVQWVCSRERRIALYKRSSINQSLVGYPIDCQDSHVHSINWQADQLLDKLTSFLTGYAGNLNNHWLPPPPPPPLKWCLLSTNTDPVHSYVRAFIALCFSRPKRTRTPSVSYTGEPQGHCLLPRPVNHKDTVCSLDWWTTRTLSCA